MGPAGMTLTSCFEARNEEREARSKKSDGAMDAAVYVMMMSSSEWEGTAEGTADGFHEGDSK